MLKIKHERDCVCVVAGFRWYRESPGHEIGSLLLGLYDDAKMLHHVGVCANFSRETRRALLTFLAPYRKKALRNHPWKDLENPETRIAQASGCPAERAAGAVARTCRGSRFARNS